MTRRFIRRRAILALTALVVLGGSVLWNRLRRDDRPVTLLSEQVTLGPEPLVIQAPSGTSAWGSSLWLAVHLVRKKVCEGGEWTEEEAKRLL